MAKFTLQITKADRANDLIVTIKPANTTESLDLIRDLKDSANDGWRMIPQREGVVDDEVDIANYSLRSVDTVDEEGNPVTVTAKAELHVHGESSGSNTQYDTLAEAVAVIDSLDNSDGFLLIDEFQGNSLIVYHRPQLWITADAEDSSISKRLNSHGRVDTDRI